MISIKKISKPEVKEAIRIAYAGDKDLLNHYHVAKFNLDEAVESTMGMVEQQSKLADLVYYKVLWQKKPIGYFIIGYQNLFSFGIAIKYRKKDILLEWWKKVKGEVGNVFDCNLYKNNIRAIHFLQKQGMRAVGHMQEFNIIKLINT